MKSEKSENGRNVFVFRLKKLTIFFILLVIGLSIFGYTIYLKNFTVLPQSAINIMPEFPYSLENQKVLVISPHCDDETLGSGGLIQRARSQGSEIEVLVVTDCNHKGNGKEREQETRSAAFDLGISNENIKFLNFPELFEKRKDAKNLTSDVSSKINEEINGFSPNLVILPSEDDTHRDHSTIGKIGTNILVGKPEIKVAYYLIHYNFLRYPSPPGLHKNAFILPPAKLISADKRWYKYSLSEGEESNKENAVYKYKSQLKKSNPILRRVLFDFIRRNEIFMIKS